MNVAIARLSFKIDFLGWIWYIIYMKYEYIIFDGTDGVGKTTQLELLKSYLNRTTAVVHHTKGLGGTGRCEFQSAIRAVLLNNKFPKNNPLLEETLFCIADLEGLNQADQFMAEQKRGVILKDRGPVSHIAYALAKHGDIDIIEQVYPNLLTKEKEMFQKYKGVSIVMLPNSLEWTLKRVWNRGETILNRIENAELQKKVYETMENAHNIKWLSGLNIKYVFVSEQDSKWDIHNRILNILF